MIANPYTLKPPAEDMTLDALQDSRVTVVGGARSGIAVARLLRSAGATVFLSEHGVLADERVRLLREANVSFEAGGHTGRALEADFLVVSPGVPTTAEVVQQAIRRALPVYSEVEVASWFCLAPIVAITGSNGKTTTTRIAAHLFETAGRHTVIAGNIGLAFSDQVREATSRSVVVLEVSSFQLDHIDRFRPQVSVLLNITPDHLNRYDNSFEAYAAAKLRIIANQQAGDVCIYNHDDTHIRTHITESAHAQGFTPVAISQKEEVETGAFLRDGNIIIRIENHEEILMQAQDRSPALAGRHNLYNSLAAAMAGRVMEVRSEVIRKSLATFEGVPHRLEWVRTVDGVRYVNDSKATNVNAVWYALESYSEPVVLIAGGRDKGNDYSSLVPLIEEKARAVVAIGESKEKVLRELGSHAPEAVAADSMDGAIGEARRLAQRGDVILLSPACSSFDMFENYEDRGDTFRRIVNKL